MRGADLEVLSPSLTPNGPQIWTLHLIKVDLMSSQYSTAPKHLYCSVEKSQWHRPVPHIRCTFIVSCHVTRQALSLSPQNWIRIEKVAPKIHHNLHSDWTGTSAEVLLQPGSSAGDENKMCRFHPISQEVWKVWKGWNGKHLCKSFMKSFMLPKLSVATSNQAVWQMITT